MRPRFVLSLAVIGCLLPLGADATPPAADGPDSADPWKGKQRQEVAGLLGEPTKTKRTAGGGEVLEYKLFRVKGEAVPSPRLQLLEVPGVGLLARLLDTAGPGSEGVLSIEPSGMDKDGRPIAGGMETTVSRSVSWDPKTGEVKHSDVGEDLPALKKVKLTFELDRAGVIVGWSVAPNK